MFQDFARRLKQLHLLFNAPPELRREHTRHQVAAPMEITVADGATSVHYSTDISHGGVFVEPRIDGETGDDVRVSVGDLLRGAPACIVLNRQNGTALKFHSVVQGAALTAWLVNHPSGTLKH